MCGPGVDEALLCVLSGCLILRSVLKVSFSVLLFSDAYIDFLFVKNSLLFFSILSTADTMAGTQVSFVNRVGGWSYRNIFRYNSVRKF